MIEKEDWASRDTLSRRIYSAGATVREVPEGAEGEINLVAAKAGGGKQWTEKEPSILCPIDAIVQRVEESKKGLLVLIDEFQNLARENKTTRSLVSSMLDYFHSLVPQGRSRDKKGRQIRTMCLAAGLLDSLDVAEDLGLSRITDDDCVRLAHLSPAASEQVIRDHLSIQPNGQEVLATATDEQIARIAAAAEGYAHHLSTAAQLVQGAAASSKLEGREQLADDLVNQVIKESNMKKANLYSRRIQGLGAGREFVSVVVADLAEAWPMGIPPKVLTLAMKRVRDSLRAAGDKCKFTELTRRLQRAGVLERRDETHVFPAAVKPNDRQLDAHWVIPIPSLQSYIQANREDYEASFEGDVDIEDLTGEAAKGQFRAPRPWEWCDRAPLKSARLLPPVRKSQIVAWVKKWGDEIADW